VDALKQLKPRKRNSDFFDWFEEASRNNVEAARLLQRLCKDFSCAEELAEEIHDLEHKNDQIGHSIYQKLNKVFMPPLDREDIAALASALDDVMDYIHETADAICIYNVKDPTPVGVRLAEIIVSCTEEVVKQLPLLRQRRSMRRINTGVIELNRLENEADKLLREGVKELFKNPHDPIEVIAWSRIYETMEGVTDKSEDIGDVLRGLVIKHA
jgi:predicted phosphate transport protein (TIGR00153 family)